jgi:hypothetical protein
MSGIAGKVALTNTATTCPSTCSTAPNIVDFIGYGATADDFEGSGPAPAPLSASADLRANQGETDTDDNASDFALGAPNPRNSSSPPIDKIAPAATMNRPASFQTATSFQVGWSASDPSGIAQYVVRARHATTHLGFTPPSVLYTGAATTTRYDGSEGQTVCLSAQAQDGAGNLGAISAESCTAIPLDDVTLTAHNFTRRNAAYAYDGTVSQSAKAGASLTSTRLTAKRLALIATTCSTCGKINVKWNGGVIATLNLHSATTRHKVVLPILQFGAAQSGVVSLVTLSAARVEIDGLGVSRK